MLRADQLAFFVADILRLVKDASVSIGRISCENVGMLRNIALNSDAVLVATTAAMTEDLRARALRRNQYPGTATMGVRVRVITLAGRSRSPLAQRVIATPSKKAQFA